MRCIGSLHDERQAKHLSDFFAVSGIEHRMDMESPGTWDVWIYAEDQLERARQIYQDYLKNPPVAFDPHVAHKAEALRQKVIDEYKKNQARHIDVRTQWQGRGFFREAPITFVLIAVSVLVALYSQLGSAPQKVLHLFISEYRGGLPEISNGQIWRLITPVFLHFGFLHVFFNLMWLKDLGAVIEKVKGSAFYLFLFVVTAVFSNLGQYFYSGPSFGGMSGVVYGFLGYVWMKGRFDPGSGLILMPGVVTMMMIWFVVCLTGFLGPVANAAHGVGLLVGVIVGLVESGFFKNLKKHLG